MHLFHDWHFTEETYEVLPKRGPYDPRNDTQRTEHYDNFICSICGKTKKTEYWHRYDFM